VVNNPRFNKIAKSPARDSLVVFLDALFFKHPQNTCQTSHVIPLIHIYGGSSSTTDRRLLAIFALFEKERHISVASLLSRWSPNGISIDKTTASVTNVLLSLDPSLVFRSCQQLWSHHDRDQDQFGRKRQNELIELTYDPQLLLGFTSHLIHQSAGLKALEWVELFRTNVFSFLLCCLSAKDRSIRNVARIMFGTVSERLQVS
jgi:nucleolar pre-ribosomal-associated protein 1